MPLCIKCGESAAFHELHFEGKCYKCLVLEICRLRTIAQDLTSTNPIQREEILPAYDKYVEERLANMDKHLKNKEEAEKARIAKEKKQ